MTIHEWWTAFGEATTIDGVASGPARSFVEAALAGLPATSLVEIKEDKTTGYVGVHVEIDVERPQDLAYPIRAGSRSAFSSRRRTSVPRCWRCGATSRTPCIRTACPKKCRSHCASTIGRGRKPA